LNDGAGTDPLVGDPVLPVGTMVPDGNARTLSFPAVGKGECRVAVACDATSNSFLASLSATPEAASVGRTQEGTSAAQSGVDGARGHGAPRPPAPQHEPQVPSAPGAASGSGRSGGHVGSTLGYTAGWRNLTPCDIGSPVTLVEVSPLALFLALSLDRPG